MNIFYKKSFWAKSLVLCFAFLSFFCTLTPTLSYQVRAQSVQPIPSTILNGLREGGVDLVFGWMDVDNLQLNEFDDDLPKIKTAGGGHVRLSFSMDTIENGTTGKMRDDRWTSLKNFVNLAKNNGIVVIIDNHNAGLKMSNGEDWDEDYMGKLRNSAVKARHLSLMTDLADRAYKELDRNWFVLQPANEPIYTSGDEGVWFNYQPQLIQSMRSKCPDCVLFAMSNDWQGVGGTISSLQPKSLSWWDQRIIMDMHMYNPLPLSHCSYPGMTNNCGGKTWPGNYTDYLPASNTEFSGTWNKALLEKEFNQLWAWVASNNNVTIHFSEIGTTGDLADGPRSAYLGDLIDILASHNVGWTCYEWDKNFGIINHPKTVQKCLGTGAATTLPTTAVTSKPTVITPTPTTSTPCPKFSSGDSDCNDTIDLVDFSNFRTEFVNFRAKKLVIADAKTNFVTDNSIDLLDFSAFTQGYKAQRGML